MKPLRGIGEGPSKADWVDIRVQIRDETTGAIAEYTTDELEDKFLNTLWDFWSTSDENCPTDIGNLIDALDKNIHVIALFDPSKALLSQLDVPGAGLWSAIIQQAPIDGIDKPLGFIKRLVEIGGIVAGLAHGNLPMAVGCFKELIRSEVHHLLVEGINHVLTGDYPGTSQRSESPAESNHASHRVSLAGDSSRPARPAIARRTSQPAVNHHPAAPTARTPAAGRPLARGRLGASVDPSPGRYPVRPVATGRVPVRGRLGSPADPPTQHYRPTQQKPPSWSSPPAAKPPPLPEPPPIQRKSGRRTDRGSRWPL